MNVLSDQPTGATDNSKSPLISTSAAEADKWPQPKIINDAAASRTDEFLMQLITTSSESGIPRTQFAKCPEANRTAIKTKSLQALSSPISV
jgi:hypothetical protein